MLLVGECPPAGPQFFYVTGAMQTYTMQAFAKAHSRSFSSREEFLQYFRECGCFLDDLSLTPVYALRGPERRRALEAQVAKLAVRIRTLEPRVVVSVGLGIHRYVRTAVELSGSEAHMASGLPFAGQSHQNKYVAGLAALITRWVPCEP